MEIEKIEETIVITDNLNEVVYMLNPDGEITYITPNVERISGYNASELIGKRFTNFVYHEDLSAREEAFISALEGRNCPHSYRLVSKNGEVVWIRTNARPVYRNGEITGLQGVLTNITDLVEKERELVNARKLAEAGERDMRYLNLLMTKMLGLQSLAEIYQLITRALAKRFPECYILAISINEKTNTSKLEAMAGIDNPLLNEVIRLSGFNPLGKKFNLVPNINHMLRKGRLEYFEGGLAKFSSNEYPAVAAGIIEKIAGISNIYTIGINRDDHLLAAVHLLTTGRREITDNRFIETFVKQAGLIIEKKITAAELEEAERRARESDNLKTAFLQNISHEIRTPLNAIVGFSHILAEENGNSLKAENHLDVLTASSSRLIEVINDIIELSQLQTGQTKLNIEEFNAAAVIIETVNKFEHKASEKGIRINVKADEKIVITSDRSRVESIVNHITDNAVKFTYKGTVKVTVRKKNKNLIITVSDTGPGIEEAKQQEIFKPFVQAENALSKRGEGTGAGLPLVKGYCELLNGTVSLKSEPGKGTTVLVSLPLGAR